MPSCAWMCHLVLNVEENVCLTVLRQASLYSQSGLESYSQSDAGLLMGELRSSLVSMVGRCRLTITSNSHVNVSELGPESDPEDLYQVLTQRCLLLFKMP